MINKDNLGRVSVCRRLNPKFKIVYTGAAEESLLQLSGPLETQDELDALVEALAIMRDWLSDAPTPETP